jgi:hypothetical protein
MPAVPLFVQSEFFFPERPSGLGRIGKTAAFVAMPETTMHEDDLSKAPKNEIRRSGQIAAMQTIPITERMHDPANKHFRSSIFPANSRHQDAACLGSQVVDQESLTCSAGPATLRPGLH